MGAGARWLLGPAWGGLLLASLRTLPLRVPVHALWLLLALTAFPISRAAADPTLLPVAMASQKPNTAAHNALNVPGLGAKQSRQSGAMVIPFQSNTREMTLDSGLWLIQMRRDDGKTHVKALVVVK